MKSPQSADLTDKASDNRSQETAPAYASRLAKDVPTKPTSAKVGVGSKPEPHGISQPQDGKPKKSGADHDKLVSQAPRDNDLVDRSEARTTAGRDSRSASVPPTAALARMRPRHWGIVLTFLFFVSLPVTVAGWYLWARAQDQYASTTGFTVRQEGGTMGSDVLGGLAQIAGASAGSDPDILYRFITSQDLVRKVDSALNLREHYAALWEEDPFFSLRPEASIEELLQYWTRVVRLSFDQSSGLIEVQVRAFAPDMAQKIAQMIVSESERLVNDLNGQSRQDLMRYSQQDLKAAEDRLKAAREAMTAFRITNQVLDIESDLQARMGVLASLQQQLATALVDYGVLLTQSSSESDPRVQQAQNRIDVIRSRIEDERTSYASGETDLGNIDYPSLMAKYEGLLADRGYAEENYRMALSAADAARASAERKTRYLAIYLRPTTPEIPEYPQRLMLLSLVALFLLISWAILSLFYYSLLGK